MPDQKFFRGHIVEVADEMPECMSHFQKGCRAVIVGSYTDLYTATPQGIDYSILIIDADEKPINKTSWYDESLLTLVDDDRDKGERILQEYKNV